MRGRTYPALGSGQRIRLHYYRDGVWRSTLVPSSRTVKRSFTYTLGGSTKRGSYTSYSFVTKPPRTTRYYFSYGKSLSPRMSVRVRPALTISADATAASSGDTITFAGSVQPLTKAGAVIELQRLSGGSWRSVAESTVAADGSYEIPWTAEGGTWSFRARIGPGDQMLAGASAVVAVTVE